MKRIDDFVLMYIKPNVYNFIKFAIGFSLLFYLFIITFQYTSPFVVGFVVAILSIRPIQWVMKKFKFKTGIAVMLVNSVVFIITFIAIITFSLYIGFEIKNLILSIYNFLQENYESIIQDFESWLLSFQFVDKALINSITDMFMSSGTEMSTQLLAQSSLVFNKVLAFVSFIPNLFIVLLFSIFSAYPISIELLQTNLITKKKEHTKTEIMISESIDSVGKYVITYGLLVFITFMVTLIGFIILNIPYAFLLSVLCAILDLLPIVGTILIFVPLIIMYLMEGNYVLAIALAVLYVVIQVVRQSVQPRLLSTSLDIHPLVTLFSIFAGLKLAGFVGMLYFIALFVGYGIYKRVIIESVNSQTEIEL